MDIQVVDDNGNKIPEVAKEPMESNNLTGGVVQEQLDLRAMGQVMGVESDGDLSRYGSKLQTLLEYAKSQTQDHSPENLKWVIRSLELRLGTPPFAEKRINYVARYAYLMAEESRLRKEREAFERG